jgi:hypothetical protein
MGQWEGQRSILDPRGWNCDGFITECGSKYTEF